MLTLRALSQTCRRLRAFTLPLLWKHVHVDSVTELGRLVETLKVLPFVAQHVKVFLMRWNGPGKQPDHAPLFGVQEISPLDFAFSDRSQTWAQLAEREGIINTDSMQREVQHHAGTYAPQASFRIGAIEYRDPGRPPLIDGRDPSIVDSYDWAAPRVGGSGPDGKGEDRLIKNAEDFNQAVTEVITRLECFGWSTKLARMSLEAFQALERLPRLLRLHLDLTTDHCKSAWPGMSPSFFTITERSD